MSITSTVAQNLENLRNSKDLTQDAVAGQLGVSRATYINIESGKSKPNIEQLEKLAKIYDASISELIDTPRNNEKFEQLYLYVLSHFKGGIPKTKLAKILYLADFSWYYDTLESMTGMRYVRRQYGPVADTFFELTESLYDGGKINIEVLDRGAFMISRSASTRPQEDLLSTDEKKRVDEICKTWENARTEEIVNFTHAQRPWQACADGEYIPYSLITQEDPQHVYKPYTS